MFLFFLGVNVFYIFILGVHVFFLYFQNEILLLSFYPCLLTFSCSTLWAVSMVITPHLIPKCIVNCAQSRLPQVGSRNTLFYIFAPTWTHIAVHWSHVPKSNTCIQTSYLSQISQIIYVEKKIVMWRIFSFPFMTIAGK